eukprot:298165-Rhodomonas_salina.1
MLNNTKVNGKLTPQNESRPGGVMLADGIEEDFMLQREDIYDLFNDVMLSVVGQWDISNNKRQKKDVDTLQFALEQWGTIITGCENVHYMPDAEAALQQLHTFAPQAYACPQNPKPSEMIWAAVNTLLSILKRFVFSERKVVWRTERNEAIRQLRWAIFLPKWFEGIAGPGGRKKTLRHFLEFTTQ